MMPISRNAVIMRKQDILSAEIDGKTILMGIDSGNYYGFNDIASRIWALIENGTSVDQVINRLTQEYNVSDETCEKEVSSFLNQLNNDKLLQVLSE